MLISYDRNFLFVHVPKAGGTSVRCALSPYSHDASDFWVNRLLAIAGVRTNHLIGNHRHYRFRTHERAASIASALPTETFEQLFKFAIVRNPWEALVSLFNYIKKTPNHKRHKNVVKMSFPEFLEFAIAKRIFLQKEMLSDARGRLLVDFIGRFETLDADFEKITNRIGVKASLPHLNQNKISVHQEYYRSQDIQTVRFAFRDDVDTFGFEF